MFLLRYTRETITRAYADQDRLARASSIRDQWPSASENRSAGPSGDGRFVGSRRQALRGIGGRLAVYFWKTELINSTGVFDDYY